MKAIENIEVIAESNNTEVVEGKERNILRHQIHTPPALGKARLLIIPLK